ncbi:MAG: DUF2442 domain-containing protein [Verrucomicrobia bacterium]|nr:MAG: DUF2442 domain-containing protein [Verrucomicrobiota bacterium]PYK95928.1 MAG: DUF2442 domain-containing protein [Verrucomicrobiota bacterium]PYL39564.1 MAG: DUF2442 domain-containing protein [Verrucomicrobiota bacterium]PYL57721.1 MAG: DUF2442 domain-containing protein [Verrucomicrobiota bacterium]
MIDAVRSWVEDGPVWFGLSDQRLISFPVSTYRRLAGAPENLVKRVQLRVQGHALRWEELDEDIWVKDAIAGRFSSPHAHA